MKEEESYYRKQNITFDINCLYVEELEALRDILKSHGMMDQCETVSMLIAYKDGWITKEHREFYYNKFMKKLGDD